MMLVNLKRLENLLNSVTDSEVNNFCMLGLNNRHFRSGPKGIWTLGLSIISRTLHQAELSAPFANF